MPSRLPDNYKSLVIQEWLKGEQRDKIAADNGISAGSVTNIVNEWKAALGFPTADALRELGVTLRRVGITAAQSALGFRITTLMHRIGVEEDSFESFILDVYNRCNDIGLSPEYIASCLADLLEFSKTVMPISRIPDYVKEKAWEKRRVEEEIEKLKPQIETLQQQKAAAESLRDIALQNGRITSSELKSYTSLREELRKYGIPVDDISKFAKLVNNIREYGYDAGEVMKEFADLDGLRSEIKYSYETVRYWEKENKNLQAQRSALELFVNAHNQLLNKYNYLKVMGLGLKELTFLWNIVNECA